MIKSLISGPRPELLIGQVVVVVVGVTHWRVDG
jgi:hypothetical protein